jgi:2-polyprenyl-6-methoxyphenol hydroxylase-like FAD-dependent oxidoreductase
MLGNGVVIIGGGLSGLCLAHALAAQGTLVSVFERDTGPDIRGQGYRLTIDARHTSGGGRSLADALRGLADRHGTEVFLIKTSLRLGR